MLRPYTVAGIMSIPSPHVADVVHMHVLQSDVAQHFRNPRPARRFRARRRGNGRQRSLAGERRFVRAFDVRARGADAFVEEDGVDHVSKL